MAEEPFFKGKSIGIIERDAKNTNDRTWCFWAKKEESLPDCTFKKWGQAKFLSPNADLDFSLQPYQYHMVRSAEFYAWAKSKIKNRVDWIVDEANTIQVQSDSTNKKAIIIGQKTTYQATWLFNSAFLPKKLHPEAVNLIEKPYFSLQKNTKKASNSRPSTDLLQHFKGYYIKANRPIFDVEKIHLMDFRINQNGETRFFYVLPFNSHEALVEFTLFSKELLPTDAYDKAIRDYLKTFWNLEDFLIEETEFGIIPMTDFNFSQEKLSPILHIGTAGGFVKASSGYTYLRTQRKIKQLIEHWVTTGSPELEADSAWKRFMDSVLLDVLAKKRITGADVFSALFQRCPPDLILRFLDEDTSFWEDLRIVWAMPKLPFMRSAFSVLFSF